MADSIILVLERTDTLFSFPFTKVHDRIFIFGIVLIFRIGGEEHLAEVIIDGHIATRIFTNGGGNCRFQHIEVLSGDDVVEPDGLEEGVGNAGAGLTVLLDDGDDLDVLDVAVMKHGSGDGQLENAQGGFGLVALKIAYPEAKLHAVLAIPSTEETSKVFQYFSIFS